LAFALLCVLAIALLQRDGQLLGLNHGLMTLAGIWRETDIGGHVTVVMKLASAVGGTAVRLVLIALILLPLIWAGRRAAAIWLALVVAGGTLLNVLLKQIFAAPRPDLLPRLDLVHSYSFASGHASGNVMFFGAVAMLAGDRIAYGAAGAMIALIGISRVWLGVHWPSDVLAGWIEGIGWLIFAAVWLPARGRQEQRAGHAVAGRHTVDGDEAMDPEAVDSAGEGDRQ